METPLSGKSHFALFCVKALLEGSSLLGRGADGATHRVVWAPTDPGGRFELAGRANTIGLDTHRFRVEGQLPRVGDDKAWAEAIRGWRAFGATLVVVDNLTGLCEPGADMNNTSGVGPPLSQLQQVCDVEGIAVLLLHHTDKRGGKTPVGSYETSAKARKILLLEVPNEGRKDVKKLTVTDNSGPGWCTHLRLGLDDDPPTCELTATPMGGRKNKRDMNKRQDAAKFLLSLPAEGLSSKTKAGKALCDAGHSKTPEGGRKMVERIVKTGVMAELPDGSLGPGPNAHRT